MAGGKPGSVRVKLRGRARGSLVAVNAAWTLVGLTVVAFVAEGWARSKADFRSSAGKHYVHPKAGRLYVPGSESRYTNMLDYWNVSRANRWGFLAPPPPHAPSRRVA